jgi:glucose-1-phosphate cytidylyltransferase
MSLYRHGFRNFVLPLGYRGKMIAEYLRGVSRALDCHLACVDTGLDSEIADRIMQVAPLLPDHGDFFILNSDTIFDFDIEEMYRHHRESDALVTLSSVEVVSHWGLILMQGENLVGFDRQRKVHHLIASEDRSLEGHVNSGLAWVNKDALDLVDVTQGDFETLLYGKAIELGRAAHFRLDGLWFPIDTPKDLHVMNLHVADRHDSGRAAQAVKASLSAIAPSSGEGDG